MKAYSVRYDQEPLAKTRKPPKPRPTPSQPRKAYRYPEPEPERMFSSAEEAIAAGYMVVT